MRIRYKHLTHLLTLCVLITLLIGSAATVIPVAAADQTVTNLNDSGLGSLRQAITDANTGDRIIFEPTLSGETITLTSGWLFIDKDLRIDGSDLDEPIIISGGNTSLVFNIDADVTVTLDSLSIQNGDAGSGLYGGGIYNKGTLNLLNSVVSDNEASFGGGIYNCGTLSMTSNRLTGNTADNQGGGIYNFSGPGCLGTLTITGSTFSGNEAGDSGGGIYNEGSLTVTNSTLTKNISDDRGGGIYNSGTLTVTNSTISANEAGDSGGGISNLFAGFATLTKSTLSHNTTDENGGGIHNYDSTLTLTNCTLTGNPASELSGMGGAIHNQSALTLTNSTLSGNVASDGGGIYNTSDGTLNYTNTIIANSHYGDDCFNNDGTIGTNVRNLVEVGNCGVSYSTANPMIGPLADNGGLTFTHALLTGSPAINAGDLGFCPSTDQRGLPRPQGAGCDIGAYEFEYLEVFLPLILR